MTNVTPQSSNQRVTLVGKAMNIKVRDEILGHAVNIILSRNM
jgi:hypothetical protein